MVSTSVQNTFDVPWGWNRDDIYGFNVPLRNVTFSCTFKHNSPKIPCFFFMPTYILYCPYSLRHFILNTLNRTGLKLKRISTLDKPLSTDQHYVLGFSNSSSTPLSRHLSTLTILLLIASIVVLNILLGIPFATFSLDTHASSRSKILPTLRYFPMSLVPSSTTLESSNFRYVSLLRILPLLLCRR